MQWDVNFLFSKTRRLLGLPHEFIVGSHPRLMLENLRKISHELKVAVITMFSDNYVVEYNPSPPHNNGKPPRNPNIDIHKPPRFLTWH